MIGPASASESAARTPRGPRGVGAGHHPDIDVFRWTVHVSCSCKHFDKHWRSQRARDPRLLEAAKRSWCKHVDDFDRMISGF